MKFKAMMAVAALAAVCGCRETAGTRVTVDATTGEAHVLECSPRLAHRVRVVRVTYGETEGIRRATVTLESLTHRRQELQARMVWLDAEGTEVDPDGKSFKAIVLDGKDVTTVTGMAPREGCVTARLQVRETKTVD